MGRVSATLLAVATASEQLEFFAFLRVIFRKITDPDLLPIHDSVCGLDDDSIRNTWSFAIPEPRRIGSLSASMVEH